MRKSSFALLACAAAAVWGMALVATPVGAAPDYVPAVHIGEHFTGNQAKAAHLLCDQLSDRCGSRYRDYRRRHNGECIACECAPLQPYLLTLSCSSSCLCLPAYHCVSV